MSVRTPVGTIGIRGTAVGGNITTDGTNSTVTLFADPRGQSIHHTQTASQRPP